MYRVYKYLLLLWWSSSERWPIKIWFGFIVVCARRCCFFFCFFFFLFLFAYECFGFFLSIFFSLLVLVQGIHRHAYYILQLTIHIQFVHISSTWFCPYLVRFLSYTQSQPIRSATTVTTKPASRKSFFLALLCILILKMIVGLNHWDVLVVVVVVDLLTNATYYHYYIIFILIKPYFDIDLFFIPFYLFRLVNIFIRIVTANLSSINIPLSRK